MLLSNLSTVASSFSLILYVRFYFFTVPVTKPAPYRRTAAARPFPTDGWERGRKRGVSCVLSGRAFTRASRLASASDRARGGGQTPVSSYVCVECM